MGSNLAPPQLSVCIVVLNGNKHIGQALESVVNQKYPSLELIVIDGGSTDGTLETIRKYSQHIRHLVSEPDRGIYDAMNKACAKAQGDWLIFLGCDDVMLDSLGPIADSVQQRDVIYYGNVILKTSKLRYGGPFSKYRLMQKNIAHQSIFYPRDVYKTIAYSSKYKLFADYEYNIRLKGRGYRFEYLNIDVAIYNDAGASAQGDANFARDKVKIIRENFGLSWAALKVLRIAALAPFHMINRYNSR
jgi:glycosyltransferase involved in cell wall biosynthesis